MEDDCCGVMRRMVYVLIETCAFCEMDTQIGLWEAMTEVTRMEGGRRSRMSENTSPYSLFIEDSVTLLSVLEKKLSRCLNMAREASLPLLKVSI